MLSITGMEAPRVIQSQHIQEQLEPVLNRLHLPATLLERVAGVHERRWWDHTMAFDDAAVHVGAKAIAEAGIEPSEVGMLINSSVTRKHLEPSVAVKVHHGLGLPSSAMNFDIANACLGFVNAITLAATMIDAGQIRYAVVVDGEDSEDAQRATIDRLLRPGVTRADFNNEFATLTLGSGAAAAVLGPTSEHPGAHSVKGGITRAASQHYDVCVGDVSGMRTDTKLLLEGGMELVVDAWNEAKDEWNWSDMDRYVMHQVSNVHTSAILNAVSIDRAKVPLTYPHFGNVGPASLPLTLAGEADSLGSGDRVLCMGVGSGLNTAMTEIEW
ncbi:3-oxoacyl-ACP synthase III [Spelaeicoccus albus]|uniref:3-oxoacyl-[acyl-carrier-protein] synthase-3 n=1 Tax=Spelaeicoccus albus TaxID=1280376 RepID=A0A7Z0D4S9_9MICO|nr:3-oxoacyl-[acyl-carrier-protein] synthase-3 [Spelaeicoccus albus]